MAGCAVSASGIATIGNDAAMTTLRIFPIVHSPVRRTDAASFGGFDNRGVANPGKLFSCRAHCYPAVADRRKLPVLSRDSFRRNVRSEEHTSELQSLMRISYAVFCLKKKTTLNLDIS